MRQCLHRWLDAAPPGGLIAISIADGIGEDGGRTRMSRQEKVGFCTLCRSRCGTINVVEDGRLIQVKPNPAHPTGKALCPKGRAAPEIVHSARRLTHPLRRTAPKGARDPAFVRITWEEALGEISSRLDQHRRETGPESVAFGITSGSSSSTSDGIDWIQRFIRSFGSPNTCFSTEICNWHKDHAHAFTFGCGLPTPDYRNSDLILLWGHNPAHSWLAQADAIGSARGRGARVVVIDPRRSGSARDADLWLRVKPGTDAALALGLSRILIAKGTYDEQFVRDWSNGAFLVREDDGRFLRGGDLGWEDAAAFVAWDLDTGRPAEPKGLANAALRGAFQVAGRDGAIACRPAFQHYVDAADLFDLARVELVTGIAGEDVERLAEALGEAKSVSYHGWTGIGQHTNATQTERAIATLYALTGSFDIPGGNVRMAAQPIPALHAMTMMAPEQRAKALGLKARPIGPPADGWITSTDLYDAILSGVPYRVRSLVTFGSNLLVSHPAPERGREALRSLELHVHCDLLLNPTAEYADIVLPVSSAWENEALRFGFEITAEAQELVQLRQPMVDRLGECRSDMEIVFDLANRLGLGDRFFDGDIAAGFEHLLAPVGLTLEQLRRHPEGIRVPLVQRYRKYRQDGFATQTGRAELYSELLLRHGYPAVPTFIPPAEKPSETHPLRLLSANSGYFCHSQHRGINTLRSRRPEPIAELHPDLAGQHDIANGDWILLSTRLGSIKLKSSLNGDLAIDQVVSDYGWWQAAPDLGLPGYAVDAVSGSNLNTIISEAERDPTSGALPLRSFACRIEKLPSQPWRDWRTFTVVERRQETESDLALCLEPTDGIALPRYRPGQFVSIRAHGLIRSYSLIGASDRHAEAYWIGVRHLRGGAMSSALAERLKVGDSVELQAPAGRFLLPLQNEFPIVLIAGGIGITPFLSYLETLTGSATEPTVVLHYVCRDAGSRPFDARLKELEGRLPKLTVVRHLSRPTPGDVADRVGRFTVGDIDRSLIERRARFYLCASQAFLEDAVAGLVSRGVPLFEIFQERFRSDGTALLGELAPRTIHFARSTKTILWRPEDGPLLGLLESAGLRPPSGCRVGQCENCALTILSGTVQHLVNAHDIDASQCLTCQAVPTSDLTFDF